MQLPIIIHHTIRDGAKTLVRREETILVHEGKITVKTNANDVFGSMTLLIFWALNTATIVLLQ